MKDKNDRARARRITLTRRSRLLAGTMIVAAALTGASLGTPTPAKAQAPAPGQAQQQARPNILVIFGDDIGQSNISAYAHGLVGYKTPNIDRIAREGMMFTDFVGWVEWFARPNNSRR